MKHLKKFVALMFCLFTAVCTAYAQDEDVAVMYNGNLLEFSDVAPIIIDGRTMLPFRGVFEQMGAAVDYDDATRTARAVFNGNEISFSIDSTQIYSSQSADPIYVMDVSPVIIDGRTLVPVRAVAEAGGLSVGWDSERRTVVVIDAEALKNRLSDACAIEGLKALFENPETIYTQDERYTVSSSDASVKVNVIANAVSDGEFRSVSCIFSAKAPDFFVEDAVMDFIVTPDALYVKTDVFEKLTAANSDSGVPLALPLSADKWFKSDWGELETFISGNDNGVLSAAAAKIGTPGSEIISAANQYIDALAQTALSSLDPDSAAASEEFFSQTAADYEILAQEFLTLTLNPDDAAVEISIPVWTQGMDFCGSFKGTYSNGAALSYEVDLKNSDILISGSSRAQTGETVEKIILPDNAANLVDALYTLLRL